MLYFKNRCSILILVLISSFYSTTAIHAQVAAPTPLSSLRSQKINPASIEQTEPISSVENSFFQAKSIELNNSQQIKHWLEDLKVQPLVEPAGQTYTPTLSAGIPSAFGASGGDVFVGASGATAGKLRDTVDSSLSMGFGLGDRYQTAGLETSYNILSIRNFAYNGSFDAKIHRVIYRQSQTEIAAAIGWNNFANYGSDVGGTDSSVYGALTTVFQSQPDNAENKMPILITLGAGGGTFRQDTTTTGIFGGVGLQIHPQVGMGAAWSGVGLNLSISGVPNPTIPLTLNALVVDTTNNSQGGTIFILNIGYGSNFLPRF